MNMDNLLLRESMDVIGRVGFEKEMGALEDFMEGDVGSGASVDVMLRCTHEARCCRPCAEPHLSWATLPDCSLMSWQRLWMLCLRLHATRHAAAALLLCWHLAQLRMPFRAAHEAQQAFSLQACGWAAVLVVEHLCVMSGRARAQVERRARQGPQRMLKIWRKDVRNGYRLMEQWQVRSGHSQTGS